ncbi:MAG: hypothetical protein KC613_01110 [Myxococcales bacterium]|nr:hypothetical protein [Myxococcales bacterium]MCB9526045.1 hypothetical protein [Myxococcales bacterium]
MRLELGGPGAAHAADRIARLAKDRWGLTAHGVPGADGMVLNLVGFEPEGHPMVSQSQRKLREAELAELVVDVRQTHPEFKIRMVLDAPRVPDEPEEATSAQMEEAVVALSEAFSKFLDLKDARQIAETGGFLGNVLAAGNLFDQARFFFEKARDMYRLIKDHERAEAMQMILDALEE